MNTCGNFRNDFRVKCDEPAGHPGDHSGILHGERVHWDRGTGMPVEFRESEGADTQTGQGAAVMTEVEHRVVRRLAEVWQDFVTLTGDGPNRDDDLGEVALKIHDLQCRALAQAAARAYPHLYRALGDVVPSD